MTRDEMIQRIADLSRLVVDLRLERDALLDSLRRATTERDAITRTAQSAGLPIPSRKHS